jgi:hypothetical protein
MQHIGRNAASALLTYGLHYTALKAYNYFCLPQGMLGFLQGMVLVGSPICQSAQTIVTSSQVSYTALLTTGIARMIIDVAIPGIVGSTPHKTS